MSHRRDPHFDAIRRYLAPPSPDWFWHWGDSGKVLLWRDGQTIAFREELIAVLRRHDARGLPPLDCVVLLLAATRESWPDTKYQIASWNAFEHEAGHGRDTLELLDGVHALPSEHRETVDAKTELAGLVFEVFGSRLSARLTKSVLETLTAGPDLRLLEPRTTGARIEQPGRFRATAFRHGLARVDAEILQLRSKIGLDELPGPVPDANDLMPSARARTLVRNLQNDQELGGLARVARRLMGAVHLPQHVSEQHDLPLGGVSDLTNRGELDRLLLSELAHDDLTLAVRIALNEALYLRRESPPRIPPSGRALLIDVGIRMWGIPRVFAVAVGLALAAACDKRTDVSSFHSQGPEAVATDLTTRDGLVAHLAALEPDPHPGAALKPFLAAAIQDNEPIDCVVITCEEVLQDDEFQRALANLTFSSLFLATVARDGRFRLELRTPHGTRLVREAELNLDDLFATPRHPPPPLLDKSRYPSLPVVFSIDPFPLRLSVSRRRISVSWAIVPDGILALTNDRRLLYWDRDDQGAVQIAEHLPRCDKLYWSSPEVKEGKSLAVVGLASSPTLHLLKIDLKEASCQMMEMETRGNAANPKSVCAHHGALFVWGLNGVQVYEQKTGRWIEEVGRDRSFIRLCYDSAATRFVAAPESSGSPARVWQALSFDGLRASWEPVTSGSGEKMPPLIALFDWHGHDGPIGVGINGDLFCTATGEWTRLKPPLQDGIRVHRVSARGDHVIILGLPLRAIANSLSQFRREGHFRVVETATGIVSTTMNDPRMGINEDTSNVRPPERLFWNQTRTQFKAILVDDRYNLVLVSRRRHLWRIVLNEELDRLELCHAQARIVTSTTVSSMGVTEDSVSCDCKRWQSSDSLRVSEPVPASPKKSYRVRVSKWPDGSRAYFDSRGLLHLVSSDTTIPETTIVLHEPELSGWCADGRTWGKTYFTGRSQNVSAAVIYDEVLQPFSRTATC